MLIDIYDEVDRWAINYIVYHKEHLREYGDVAKATSHFNGKFQKEIADIKTRTQQGQIAAMQSMMRAQASSAAGSLKILSRLQDGTLLSDTLDRVAEAINNGIDQAGGDVTFSNYNEIVRRAKNFSGMLSKDNRVVQVNKFFDLLLTAMDQAKLLDPIILDALSNIGSQLAGTEFAIDSKYMKQAIGVTSNDIAASQKVIDALNRAASKLQQEGSVSSRSFAATISYIFQSVIGQEVEKVIVASGLAMVDEELESIIDQQIKVSNGKLKRTTSRNKAYTNTINVNLFDRDVFQLKLRGSAHASYNIEIANASSIQWARKGNRPALSVKREESLRDYFINGEDAYLAYNMISHRYSGPDFEEAFEQIQASTAASFFNQWIQGGQIPSITKNLQYVVVNGKLYPISRIIENICWGIQKENTSTFSMNIETGKTNQWIGRGPNKENAIRRSAIVNEVMNTFIIAGRLNSNILTQYAY